MDVDLSAPLLLDGATATNLMDHIPPDLCIPQWIAEHPEQILALQRRYVSLGCDIIYAPTFGANSPQLAACGLESRMEELNRELVALSRQAADGKAAVAGVLSPTGLSLEPYGEASFTEVLQAFRDQAAILEEAGADLFAVETMVSIAEARAAVLALQKFDKPVIVTVVTDEAGNMPHGDPALNALVTLQSLGIDAFGINCSSMEDTEAVLRQMKPYAKIPFIAKPSACTYNEDHRPAGKLTPAQFQEQAAGLIRAGASIIGGCCGTSPEHLEGTKALLAGKPAYKGHIPEENLLGDIILADLHQTYHLFCDQIECSKPLSCSFDMTDDFLRLESQQIDVITILLESVDDAKCFGENAHLATLPICFYAHDDLALGLALMLYAGRAMVDSRSSLESEVLKEIAQKYGAVIY